jgi:hypothetical protein
MCGFEKEMTEIDGWDRAFIKKIIQFGKNNGNY